MIKLFIFLTLGIMWIWIGYEIWRAPMIEETDDGKFIVKRPAKSFKDLFKSKSKTKNTPNTIADLEKLGRGRSKY